MRFLDPLDEQIVSKPHATAESEEISSIQYPNSAVCGECSNCKELAKTAAKDPAKCEVTGFLQYIDKLSLSNV